MGSDSPGASFFCRFHVNDGILSCPRRISATTRRRLFNDALIDLQYNSKIDIWWII